MLCFKKLCFKKPCWKKRRRAGDRWLKPAAALGLMLSGCPAIAQELFVYTEPASNMPAHSLGLRASNWAMRERAAGGGGLNYHFIPEAMWGVSKSLMLHAEGFFSNRDGGFVAEGGAVYAKYRFLSRDGDHRHFRMAVYGRASVNNSSVHQEEIETNGHNSGLEGGLIATQLLHKTALSATASLERAMDGERAREYSRTLATDAVNYTFSMGQLLLPKKYTGYGQTNLSVMVEVLGQTLPQTGRSFLDVAPAVQLIFNSQTRVDVGYRQQLYSTMERTAPNGWMLRVEHVLFGVL